MDIRISDDARIAIIVPTYNNPLTIERVVCESQRHCRDVIVVDDGSNDNAGEIIRNMRSSVKGLVVIVHEKNQGKGFALKAGFEKALSLGFTHAITIDADGQHYPDDVPLFFEKIKENPDSLYIGQRTVQGNETGQPLRSSVGAKFGAFWYKFFTGIALVDTQSGFRAYPLQKVAMLGCKGGKYEYEQDVLIKAAWAGIGIVGIPIHLHYEPRDARVSHFRPVRDFLRISKVNSKAALIKIFLPFLIVDMPGISWKDKIIALLKRELSANSSPKRAASSISLGIFFGLLPIYGFQVISLMALSFILRLNRPLAFLGVSISSPPFLPFVIAAAIAVGKMVVPPSLTIAAAHFKYGAIINGGINWFFGSIVLAVALSVAGWFVGYFSFVNLQKARSQKKG